MKRTLTIALSIVTVVILGSFFAICRYCAEDVD